MKKDHTCLLCEINTIIEDEVICQVCMPIFDQKLAEYLVNNTNVTKH